MKLRELKKLLDANRDKQFMLVLPGQNPVPESFHVTEVGHVSKKFIDCGGAVHSIQTCQLQVWVGDDEQHRLNTGTLADILGIARSVVPDDELDVEIEYEDQLISQYPIVEHAIRGDRVILQLAAKHTDCLAKDRCVAPAPASSSACCGPGCCS